MRRRLATGLGLFLALLTSPAGAWSELAPRVDVAMEPGHATIVTRRTVVNDSDEDAFAHLTIAVPQGAVATRLRVAPAGAPLREAMLEAAVTAETLFEGGSRSGPSALLSWEEGSLSLRVSPVPAHGSVVVEVTTLAPVSLEKGRYALALGGSGTESAPATVRITGGGLEIDGASYRGEARKTTWEPLEVKLVAPPRSGLSGALASVPAGGRHFLHARIDAGTLSQLPTHPAVAILLDSSRSAERSFDAQIAAARGYLANVPGAEVTVLTFDRAVHQPFGGLMPATQMLPRLQSSGLVAANGSRVDEALARADAILARSSATDRRIVLLSDLRVATSLSAAALAQRPLASGAIVHLSRVREGAWVSTSRSDEDPWAAVPRATGGLLWDTTLTVASSTEIKSALEDWARPRRVDGVRFENVPEEQQWFFTPSLEEGHGWSGHVVHASPLSEVTLVGELWSRPFRWSVKATAAEGKRWAAMAFGTSARTELQPDEQMALARHAGAVTPVTSLVVVGQAPVAAHEGLGLGSVYTRSGCACGFVLTNPEPPPSDYQTVLEGALAAAAAACGVPDPGAVQVETTSAEIVDVRARDACVAEQLWAVMLPDAPPSEAATWTLTVAGSTAAAAASSALAAPPP